MRRTRAMLLSLVAVAMCTGAAHAQTDGPATVRKEPAKPFAEFTFASAASVRDSIVALARAQVGTRYVYGGTTPKGFDCSGLIKYIMAALNIDLPRTADQQSRVGSAITKDVTTLRPGDLITFGAGKRVSHIGIYIGEGKYVHASTGAGRVIETKLTPMPLRGQKPWKGVRRLLAYADSLGG